MIAKVSKSLLTKGVLAGAALGFCLIGAGSQAAEADASHTKLLLAFTNLYGVDGPYLNAMYPFNGVLGDEAGWKVGPSAGSLTSDGHLKITVRGLIFSDGKPNDETEFRGLVSCITDDGTHISVASAVSQGFPANAAGNSNIDAHLNLPNPCLDPIVMVLAGSEDKWFAINGFED